MDSSFLDMLLALATAMGGWKGLHFVADKWASRNGIARSETENQAVLHMQKEEELFTRIHEDLERLHEGMERLNATQQTTNQILSELKGRLAQRGG